MLLVENFFVYSFWKDDTFDPQEPGSSKHTQINIVELYQSAAPDKRFDQDLFSSFSSQQPANISQGFIFPRQITSLGVSKTQSGITSRQFILGISGDQLFGLHKRLLDPRRPLGKPTSEDTEEGLIGYTPILHINPLEVLSYDQRVVGSKSIISAPTQLESTSLIISYGIDIYCTRVTPSQPFDILSSDFSYSGLIVTVVGLVIGIAFTKHFVTYFHLG